MKKTKGPTARTFLRRFDRLAHAVAGPPVLAHGPPRMSEIGDFVARGQAAQVAAEFAIAGAVLAPSSAA